MNNTYSLDQVQKPGGLKAELLMRKYNLDKLAKFMEIKSNNPRLNQSEIANMLELSSSTIQRYRKETNMLSPYRLTPSSKTNHTRKQKTPNMNIYDVKATSNDLKMKSNDLKTTSNLPFKNKKNKLRRVGFEINEKYSDEIFYDIYL